jgi:dienelactone hydrolase
VNGDWCIASNHNNEIHFDNHFFDDTAGLETKMKNNQYVQYLKSGLASLLNVSCRFATELSCDSQLFGSGMNANNQTQTLLARAKIQTTSAESFSPNLERDEKVHRTQHNTPRCYSFTAQDSASDDDPNQAIGTALKNGKYKCNMVACAEKSFKRPAELRRHYNTIHAAQKPEFWCEVVSCERSLAGPAGVAAGGQPFHRKYRLQAHMQKVHHNRVNADSCDDVTDE